ncbi:hypothetical protein R2601_11906 [Salipiger bermudensis HTCC2601]|uniref:Uncharacterized protein n=2 Tax=Salipiger TaxID=263377 RepID=Q0FIN0_SALBH|nr:DUF6525 family protein [Salipiger bermudensis]EAU44055.1 hypothetical protein R2601_11906 [Salipiger bermudensis HTCC2601]MAE88481.1 hypothetical protein [Pelagibaca sp.]MBR9890822.1 hypothetical protein [bacterium]
MGRLGAHNGQSALPRRRQSGDPMQSFDRLPPALRRWLAQAALPWSPRSAQRAWQRSLALCGGDLDAALARMTEIERRQLARDTLGPASGGGQPPTIPRSCVI